jgi:hypothetical protein
MLNIDKLSELTKFNDDYLKDIAIDSEERAKKNLGELAGKARRLRGERRDHAWKRFWDVKEHYENTGLIRPRNEPRKEDIERWAKQGLFIAYTLREARRKANALIKAGSKACIIAKDKGSGWFGVFTKSTPKKEESVVEIILPPKQGKDPGDHDRPYATVRTAKPKVVTKKYLNEDGTYRTLEYKATEVPVQKANRITPLPYRHGDKIQKSYTVFAAIDPLIASTYVTIPSVRAYTEEGAKWAVLDAAPNLTIIHTGEKATDWEEDAFPADDTICETSDNDEEYANSMADFANPWVTASDYHETMEEKIEAIAISGEEQ